MTPANSKPETGAEVSQVEGCRREVAQRCSHRERRDHDRPIERFSTRRVDGVDRKRALGLLPCDEHREQHGCVEHGGRRVRDAEAHVEHVRGHRAEHADADHRQPVRPCQIATHRELQDQGAAKADEADRDGDDWVDRVDEIAGRRLAHRGRQRLDRPEIDGDLRDAEGAAHRQPPNARAVVHRRSLPRQSRPRAAYQYTPRVISTASSWHSLTEQGDIHALRAGGSAGIAADRPLIA